MFDAQIGEGRSTWVVAIFNQISGGIPITGAKVHSQHWLDIGLAAPVDKFIGAEGLRQALRRLPSYSRRQNSRPDSA